MQPPPTETKEPDHTFNDGGDMVALNVLQQGTLEIHFIQVGQGDATLIKCPNGRTILIDCGSLDESKPSTVRNYLREQLGDDHLSVLVITHPDADHYNMIPYVLKDITIDRLVMVGEFNEYDAATFLTTASKRNGPSFSQWLAAFDSSKLSVIDEDDIDSPDAPSHELFDSGEVDIYVVAADIQGNPSPTNTGSIVLMVSHGEFDCLLTGDATFGTEKAMVERYPDEWLRLLACHENHFAACKH